MLHFVRRLRTAQALGLKLRSVKRSLFSNLMVFLSLFRSWARDGIKIPESGLEGSKLLKITRRGAFEATRPQSAQGLIEFALVSVPLLALIFGLLEFGLAFFESTNLDFAAREVARNTALCANSCDYRDPVTNVLYRDYYALRELDRTMTNLDNIEYLLIQHVGEESDLPAVGVINYGRKGPDIYANYLYHYQLYGVPKSYMAADDSRRNTVPVRTNNPLNIKLNDAKHDQIPILNGRLPYNAGMNEYNNGWRSAPCGPSDPNTECRKNVPNADDDGSPTDPPTTRPAWPGRYICAPSDRFYAQIVLRHNWITPFLPTINTDGHSSLLKGFGNTNSILLSSKAYQKVEARLYATSNLCNL